jgi:hypothetical protein
MGIRHMGLLMKTLVKVALSTVRESSGWRASRVLALSLAKTLLTKLSKSNG